MLALALPRTAASQESPRPKTSPVLVTGAVLFGASWLTSEGVALGSLIRWQVECNAAQNAASAANAHVTSFQSEVTAAEANVNEIITCGSQPQERDLWIPLAGPWVTLAQGPWNGVQTATLVADGVAQAAGIVMIAYGLLSGQLAKRPTATEAPGIVIRPGAGTSAAGLTMVAQF
jgi:hypothetical protein